MIILSSRKCRPKYIEILNRESTQNRNQNQKPKNNHNINVNQGITKRSTFDFSYYLNNFVVAVE